MDSKPPINDPSVQVDVRILQENGILFHLNRTVLHPLGLAMWVDPEGGTLGIYDATDEDGGVRYALERELVLAQAEKFDDFAEPRRRLRQSILGYWVQPIEKMWEEHDG